MADNQKPTVEVTNLTVTRDGNTLNLSFDVTAGFYVLSLFFNTPANVEPLTQTLLDSEALKACLKHTDEQQESVTLNPPTPLSTVPLPASPGNATMRATMTGQITTKEL